MTSGQNERQDEIYSDQKLSELIKLKKQNILKVWEERVRAEIPAAKKAPGPALYDSLPAFLDEVIGTFSSSTPLKKLKSSERYLAREHGQERAMMTEYGLDQILLEYNILRDVIFEVIDPEETLSLPHAKIIWYSVYIAIKNSVTEFTRIREEEKKKLHESKLLEKENHYRAIIDTVEDYAIYTLDRDGVIDFWNAGAVRMIGYTAAEVIGKHFSIIYPKDARIRNEPQEHLRIARGEGRFRGEGLRMKKNGDLFMADVYIKPLVRGNGLIGYAKIVQDLSEHNLLIQERDISKNEAMNLQVENELRDIFVATLSHDLRSPLAAAKASAQLILRNPTDQERHLKYASKIVEHINRSDKMIANFLDVNKIKAGGQLIINRGRCDLIGIVRDVVEEVATIYGHEIINRSPLEVIGKWDCDGMRRILENLLVNAVKYGDSERPVTISVENADGRVLIKVHNYGNMIELPDQLTMFEKFHRAKSVENGTTIGWGLGLTLVKGLVEAHKGVVRVDSLPLEGTTFIVDLPVEDELHDTEAQQFSDFH